MKTVNTGWRNITPGPCDVCGCDDDWECDGRGTVYCSCQLCPDCLSHDGHWTGRALVDELEESEEECRTL